MNLVQPHYGTRCHESKASENTHSEQAALKQSVTPSQYTVQLNIMRISNYTSISN
jgi:hypothetical protein